MLFQGEDIAITVTFDEEVLNQASSFILLVYPSFNVNKEPVEQEVQKSQITGNTHTRSLSPMTKRRVCPQVLTRLRF